MMYTSAGLFDERGRSLLDAGGLTENYVVQQMVAWGIEPRYWTSGNRAGEIESIPLYAVGCLTDELVAGQRAGGFPAPM